MIEFGVLGPLTVHRDRQPVALNATMLRGLLSLLLHRPGRPVSVACIEDTLWSGRPPSSVRKTIQVYVGRLRKALGEKTRVQHSPEGYVILLAADELDAIRFRTRIEAGRAARCHGDLITADRLLTEALGLWRGTPFADLDRNGVIAEQAVSLEEQWAAAQELRAAVRLDLRRHAEVVADLAGPVAAHPYQERLAAYLMLALYRSDRQSDALNLYWRTRDLFVAELGLEPGPTMSRLHQAILRTDAWLWRITTVDLEGRNAPPLASQG